MVLVVNIFVFFNLNFFAFLLLYVTWCKILQFHGHHSYFRKDFQMLLAANIGHNVHSFHIATAKQTNLISKIRKDDH